MRGSSAPSLRPGSPTSAQLSRCWNIINQHNKPLFRPKHPGFLGMGRVSVLGGWGGISSGLFYGGGATFRGRKTPTWPRGLDACGKWRKGWMPCGSRGQSLCPRSPGLMATEAVSMRASAAYGVCRRTTHLSVCPRRQGPWRGLELKL